MKVNAEFFGDSFLDVFAERLDVCGGGVVGIYDKVGVNAAHFCAADAESF